MFSIAELVEFIDNVIELRAECVEHNRKFSLLLLHVHQKSVERWNQVVLAISEKGCVHFAFSLQTSLLSGLCWVNILIIFIGLFLFFFVINGHAAILVDAKLFTGTFRKGQRFEHFFLLVLKFGARATRASELLDKFHASLLDSGVVGAVFKFLTLLGDIDVVHVTDNIAFIFSIRDIGEHGWILRLSESQLVMCQNPMRFSLCFIASLDLLLTELTPSTLANNATNIVNEAEAFSFILHKDSVV